MTEKSYPYDGIALGDASYAPYSSAEWTYFWKLRHGITPRFPNYGVLKGTGDGTYEPLTVLESTIPSTNISVKQGTALVNGRLYENTAAEALAIGANASGNPRIDTVILRLDDVAQTTRLVVKQGTPAASPARPTLTQTDGTLWEMPLADIAVANGFSTITNANITPRQRPVHSSVFGWQSFAYPISYIPNGNYDAVSVDIVNSGAVAIPILLTGNMLLDSMSFRKLVTVSLIVTEWGLYVQDVNDANSGESTLRQIAYGTANVASGAAATVTIPVTRSRPQIIVPGAYWLVIKANASTLPLGAITASGFQASGNSHQNKTSTTVIDATTLNFTSWTAGTQIIAARLNGRVFGQTSAF